MSIGFKGTKEKQREIILSAAKPLFMEQGYEATSLNQIAQETDIKEREIFKVFESKSDLFIEVLASEFQLDQDPKEITFAKTDLNKASSEIVYEYILNRLNSYRLFGKKMMKEVMSLGLSLAKTKPEMIKKFIHLDFLFVDDLIEFLDELKGKHVLDDSFDSVQAAETIYSTLAFEFLIYIYQENHTQEQFQQGIKKKVDFIMN
ncbi:TetR/AcrR family transcriptional regulator [Pontibacillus sp. HMF3514]|uniref:TetR/AcrR family transcriptional regulator n=1 Tax=Pontibacillus sp. HMF3514 TaxID=2692425 RepID=UPI00131F985E|nr:TetR/AcrR family transcriptional regulator [Pontibacillus sp. HMF3514]QHE51136.1 TetR family transcriptional regulator [Pontibacillus sp. HMF3514]